MNMPNRNAVPLEPSDHIGCSATAGEGYRRFRPAFVNHSLVANAPRCRIIKRAIASLPDNRTRSFNVVPTGGHVIRRDAGSLRPFFAQSVGTGRFTLNEYVDTMLSMERRQRPLNKLSVGKAASTCDHNPHARMVAQSEAKATL